MGVHNCFLHTHCFVSGNKTILRHLWWAFHHLSAHITICKAAVFRHGAPLLRRCSGCRAAPFDICVGSGCHLWVWWDFFFPFLPLSPSPPPSRTTTDCTPVNKSCLKCSPTSLFYLIYFYIFKVSTLCSVPRFDIFCLRKRPPTCYTHVLALMYK